MKLQQKDFLQIAVAAVAIVVIWKFGKKLTEFLGLTDSPAEQRREQNVQNKWLTPIPYNDWVKEKNYKIPSQIENFVIPSLVNKIHDAKGLFNDDEDAVYNFFRKLETKMQVSATAHFFKQTFGVDLSQYLDSFMSAEELQKVSEIVDMKKEKFTNGLISANFGK